MATGRFDPILIVFGMGSALGPRSRMAEPARGLSGLGLEQAESRTRGPVCGTRFGSIKDRHGRESDVGRSLSEPRLVTQS